MSIPILPLGSQGLKASALGYGAMGLTAFYGAPVDDDQGVAVMKKMYELGINLIDTAEAYRCMKDGKMVTNEALVGKAVKEIGRGNVVISTKHAPHGWEKLFMMLQGQKVELTKPEELRDVIRKSCEDSLKELDVDCIDLYYLHRMYQPPITIEQVMEVFKELVQEGKIKYVGLSEAPPDYIRRAHAIHPITAIQQEWSLIARDLEEEGGIVDTCRELGIGIVPYSPVARGFLSGQHQDKPAEDWRASVPFMKAENLAENSAVVKEIEAMATAKGITLSQLSLAWVCNQGKDVFPIPGTTKIPHLEDNAASAKVELTQDEMIKIEEAAKKIKGERGDERYLSMSFHGFK